jgi:hypothetical protein
MLRVFCVLVCLTGCGVSQDPSSFSSADFVKGGGDFPKEPDPQLTPGSTCKDADELRYPEHIKYCERSVPSSLKDSIIDEYDSDFGYTIAEMQRTDFKIDHYIALCMGGSNERKNLWPQHKSLFVITDPIEQKLCQVMAMGAMEQTEAIVKIKEVKHNLSMAPQLVEQLDSIIQKKR